MTATPTLRVERGLLRAGITRVACMDEVGRGSLGGPVTVGVVVVDAGSRTAPTGLRDSKLLTPAAREALAPRVRRWAVASAVGHASAREIDRWGIVRALRLAGERALADLPVRPDLVLLDGSHDWLTRPEPVAEQGALFDAVEEPAPWPVLEPAPPVTTRVKADLACSSVAAASVLAKTERDALMRDLGRRYPAYRWEENKGYAAPEHLQALRDHGACEEHRRSWSLPEATGAVPGVAAGMVSA